MFLNIDKQDKEKIALIDNDGYSVKYGELPELMKRIGEFVAPRSIVFNLCKNTVGSVIGYLGFVEKEAVPVTLNSKIDKELLDNLIATYTPAYLGYRRKTW